MLRPLPLFDPPDPPPKIFGKLSNEGEGDGPGDKVGDRREGDLKDDWRGGDDGLVDEECLFLVKSLVTEAVAWDVLASGNVGGGRSRGGGRVPEPVVESDTIQKSLEHQSSAKVPSGITHTRPRHRELSASLQSQRLIVHEDLPQ